MELSRDFEEYNKHNRCPRCGKTIFHSRMFVDGRAKKGINFGAPKDNSTVFQCPKCGGEWLAYQRDAIIEVLEGERQSVVAFSEEFTLDNSRGRSAFKRTKSISHEWSQAIELSTDETQSEEFGFKIGNAAANINTVAKSILSSNYKISQTETKTYSDSLEFEVPAGVSRHVTLSFKRVWQSGRIHLNYESEAGIFVPFKIVVGLEMDVTQEDFGSPI